MYALIQKSRIIQGAILLLAFLVVGCLGFYIGTAHEGPAGALGPASSMQTYASREIGISFELPSELGELQESVLERGECDPATRTETDQCEHRYIGFVRDGTPLWFLSAESRLYTMHPLPREGSYEDTLTAAGIEDYCTHGLYPLSCTTSTNPHGLRVVKVGYAPACNGFEACGGDVFFVNFIETKNPDYPVIAVWYDRSRKPYVADSVMDRIVGSIRPLR